MAGLLDLLGRKIRSLTPAYQISLAQNVQEVRLAQRLRFAVFNLELQEGLASAYDTGLDADPFDEFCEHLLVRHQPTGEVIGTYRLQTGSVAALHLGYYSAQEFDFAPYESIRSQTIELGRACIHKDHRSFIVLNMLWRGILEYAQARKARFLIGCSSLTSQDPSVGAAAYQFLRSQHLTDPARRTVPLPAYYCPLEELSSTFQSPPKLLQAYLNIGAKICGPPAIDREFKTIDFLTLLDLSTLPSSVRQHFSRAGD